MARQPYYFNICVGVHIFQVDGIVAFLIKNHVLCCRCTYFPACWLYNLHVDVTDESKTLRN